MLPVCYTIHVLVLSPCQSHVPHCRQQGRAAQHALCSLNHCLMERGPDHLSVLPAVHQQVYPLVCYVWDATSLPLKVKP